MGHYEPVTVAQLASVVEDVALALAQNGSLMSPDHKAALAKRILELYENGITDPEALGFRVMADCLGASGQVLTWQGIEL